LDEPTRGIDVLAKTEIYKLINKLSRDGISVILSSSDVTEVLSIADRIAIMRNGQISEIVERKDFNKEKVLRLMLMD
jgi:ABC-type sugar transport system ATPase subunit